MHIWSFLDSILVLCFILCSCHAPKLVPRIMNFFLPFLVKSSPGTISTRKKLKSARAELHSLSAIDQFAVHSRKKREVIQLEEQLQALEYRSSSTNTLTKAILYVLCYVIVMSFGFVNIYRKYGTPFTSIHSRILYPFNSLVSIPDLDSQNSKGSTDISFTFMGMLVYQLYSWKTGSTA